MMTIQTSTEGLAFAALQAIHWRHFNLRDWLNQFPGGTVKNLYFVNKESKQYCEYSVTGNPVVTLPDGWEQVEDIRPYRQKRDWQEVTAYDAKIKFDYRQTLKTT